MAQAAMRLLDDQDLANRIISQAREECRKYSWTAVRDKWLELYETCGSAAAQCGKALPYRADSINPT